MTFIFTDEPINSLDELMEQEVVYVTRWEKTSPVAFLQNWQARVLLNFIKHGIFKKYQKVKM